MNTTATLGHILSSICEERNKVVPVITFVIFVLVWHWSVALSGISELILPLPENVIATVFGKIDILLQNSLITLLESVLGFLIGLLVACILSVSFLFSPLLKQAFYPYVIALRAIPVIALAPLVTVWFGSGYISKVVLAATIAFFPILINLIKGFKSSPKKAVEMMSIYNASAWNIFWKVRVYYALPYFFTGLKIASSFSVIGAVVAEFTGASSGIGYIIKSSTYYNNTSLTFASILFASLVGLLFFGGVVLVERMIVHWNTDQFEMSS